MHDMLLDLSGLYVKSAQILASKGDFIPEPWCRRLAAMFDSMPPKPWAYVARVRLQPWPCCLRCAPFLCCWRPPCLQGRALDEGP